MIRRIVISLVLGAIWAGVWLFTPLPLLTIAHVLEDKGVSMLGVSGSLVTGVRVDTLQLKTGSAEVSFSDLRFSTEEPWNLLLKRRLIVTDLASQSLVVKLDSAASVRAAAAAAAPGAQAAPENAPPAAGDPAPQLSKGLAIASLFTVELRQFRISELKVARGPAPATLVGQLSGEGTKIYQLMLESPGFTLTGPGVEFNTGPLQANQQGFRFLKKGTGRVHPGVFKSLRKAATFAASAEVIDSEFALELELFDGKVKAHWDPRISYIEANGFTPAEYLETPTPIQQIVLTMQTDDPRKLGTAEASSSYRFKLGSQEFSSLAGPVGPNGLPPATATSRGVTYTFVPATLDKLPTGVSGALTSTAHSDVGEMLSELFFQRKYIHVDPENRRWVDLQKPLFSNGVNAPSRALASGELDTAAARQLEALRKLSPRQMNSLQQMREATQIQPSRQSAPSSSPGARPSSSGSSGSKPKYDGIGRPIN